MHTIQNSPVGASPEVDSFSGVDQPQLVPTGIAIIHDDGGLGVELQGLQECVDVLEVADELSVRVFVDVCLDKLYRCAAGHLECFMFNNPHHQPGHLLVVGALVAGQQAQVVGHDAPRIPTALDAGLRGGRAYLVQVAGEKHLEMLAAPIRVGQDLPACAVPDGWDGGVDGLIDGLMDGA